MVLISMHGSLTYSFLLSQSKCHNQNTDLQSSWSIWLRRTHWISRPASLPPSLRVTSLLAAAAASRLLVSPLMVRPRVAALRRMIREHPRSLGARHVCRKDFQWLAILSAKILKTTPQCSEDLCRQTPHSQVGTVPMYNCVLMFFFLQVWNHFLKGAQKPSLSLALSVLIIVKHPLHVCSVDPVQRCCSSLSCIDNSAPHSTLGCPILQCLDAVMILLASYQDSFIFLLFMIV